MRFLHYLRIENSHNILPHIPAYFQTGKGSKFRTISHNLKLFSIQCCPLVSTQPFIVHIGEDTAEAVTDESTKRYSLHLCQLLVTIAEDPVHCMPVLIEYHLNIRKGKWHLIKAPIEGMILFRCLRSVRQGKALNQFFLLFPQPGKDFFFLRVA